VDSRGNDDVRKERKEIVARVEAALEEVEKEVQERFVHRQAMKTGSVPVETKEVIVEKVELDEGSVAEVVQRGVPADVAIAVAAEALEEPTSVEEVSDHQSTENIETILTVESETSPTAAPLEGNHSRSPVNDIPVSVRAPWERDTVASLEDSSLVDSVATVTKADENTVNSIGTPASSEQHSSYPAACLTSEVSVVAEPASPTPTQGDAEVVDTFLLPATTESPVIPKRPAVNEEDELVVIDKEQGEGSDGENWSEVEA